MMQHNGKNRNTHQGMHQTDFKPRVPPTSLLHWNAQRQNRNTMSSSIAALLLPQNTGVSGAKLTPFYTYNQTCHAFKYPRLGFISLLCGFLQAVRAIMQPRLQCFKNHWQQVDPMCDCVWSTRTMQTTSQSQKLRLDECNEFKYWATWKYISSVHAEEWHRRSACAG